MSFLSDMLKTLVICALVGLVVFFIQKHEDNRRTKAWEEKNAYLKVISKIKYEITYGQGLSVICDHKTFGQVEKSHGKWTEVKRSGSISFSGCADSKAYTLVNYAKTNSCFDDCQELDATFNQRIICINQCYQTEQREPGSNVSIKYQILSL